MHNRPLEAQKTRTKHPWNNGKLIGSKPPLRTKDVWSILQGGEAHPGLGHVQSSHRQHVARPRCRPPEG